MDSSKSRREQARFAKNAAAERFRHDREITSVGIGMTEDSSDYAITITVLHEGALEKIPDRIGTVQVRAYVSGLNKLL